MLNVLCFYFGDAVIFVPEVRDDWEMWPRVGFLGDFIDLVLVNLMIRMFIWFLFPVHSIAVLKMVIDLRVFRCIFRLWLVVR